MLQTRQGDLSRDRPSHPFGVASSVGSGGDGCCSSCSLKVLPANVSHNPCSQGVTENVDHGPETIADEERKVVPSRSGKVWDLM